ncbi:MAG: hypothetical protein SGPRY_002233, partial [Prymnesium sp.]
TLSTLRAERRQLFASVDLLGLGEGGTGHDLRSSLALAQSSHVAISLVSSVPVEPGEPVWKPLCAALADWEGEEEVGGEGTLDGTWAWARAGEGGEGDVDGKEGGDARGGICFVLFSTPLVSEEGSLDRSELGRARLHLPSLFAAGREPERERLPVLSARAERVGYVTISLKLLHALRWARGGGGEGCRMSVGVGELTLAPSAVARVEELSRGRALAVKVQLPAGLPLLTTPQITLDPEGRGGSFGYTEEVAIDAGSEAHMGMIAALSAEDDSHVHVFFTLVITGERKVSRYGIRNHCVTLTSPSAACGGRERELGTASINLRDLSENGQDAIDVELSLRDDRGARGVLGFLRASLIALRAISLISHSAEVSKSRMRRPKPAELLRLARRMGGMQLEEGWVVWEGWEMDGEEGRGMRKGRGIGIDFSLLDSLSATGLEEMAAAGGRESGMGRRRGGVKEGRGRGEEREGDEVGGVGEGESQLHRLVSCGARLSAQAPRKPADFEASLWGAGRVEKLWTMGTAAALQVVALRLRAHTALAAAGMEQRGKEDEEEARAARYRRRIAEARGASPPGAGGEGASSRSGSGAGVAGDRALMHEVLALREVLSKYEELTRGLHGSLSQLAGEHLALAARCETSEASQS